MKARIPKNFGGMPNNMQSMIQQAQKMQEDITKKQAEIDEMEFTASVGGGAVEVVMSGKKELKAITIKPEVVDPPALLRHPALPVYSTPVGKRMGLNYSSRSRACNY